jgi:hypothetical protein
MTITYERIAKMLKRPVKGKRRARHNNTYYRYADDGKTIEYFVEWWTSGPTVLATITPDNVVTVKLGEDSHAIWAHNRIHFLTGRWITNDKRGNPNKEQTVRIREYIWGRNGSRDKVHDHPYFDGLQLQLKDSVTKAEFLNLGQVKDKVRTLDRDKAKEMRAKLNPLTNLFLTSFRIGALDDLIAQTTANYKYRAKAIYTLDELIATAPEDLDIGHATSLYVHALKATDVAWWGNQQETIRKRVPVNAVRILRKHAYAKAEEIGRASCRERV